MLGLLDLINLRIKPADIDDQSTKFRRSYGAGPSRVVLFLPWNISVKTAARPYILPRRFFSCYETAHGIVSSTPHIPLDCLAAVEKVFADDLEKIRQGGHEPLLIGMSMGNFPATFLANKYGLDLISIASGHSGDWLTFHSPAAAHLRRKATDAGLRESDFKDLLRPVSPVSNLRSLGSGSQFIFGTFDHYIPRYSRDVLIDQIRKERPDIPVTTVPTGHLAAIMLWRCFVRRYDDP